MNITVTGGAGFIGSHVVDVLLKQGHNVAVIDDLSNGSIYNFADHFDIYGSSAFKFVKKSILEVVPDDECMHADMMIHMAVLGVRHSIHDPMTNHNVNATATLRLLEIARHQIKKFVYISSSEVYGTARKVSQDESHPTLPHTVYGGSKLAAEAYVRAYHSTYGYPTTIIRPFNTYGPRSHYEGDAGEFIPRAIVRGLQKQDIVVYGDGSQTRDLTYVTDMADAIVKIANLEATGKTINVGSGIEYSIADLANLLATQIELHIGIRPPITFLGHRPGDVGRLLADSSQAKRLIDYRPTVTLENGLRHTIDWLSASIKGTCSLDIPLINWT